MALNKSLPFGKTGATASYWNIGEKHEDVRAKEIRVKMFGYPDESARHAEGADPLFAKDAAIGGADYKRDMTDAEIYGAITKQEGGDFADAEHA